MSKAPLGHIEIEYDALRTSVVAHRIERDVVRVSGQDAVSYLQGQCSQDVAALALGATTEALLLSPQGKMDAWVRVTRTGDDSFVIDTDRGFGEVVKSRLERFRLRVKVEFEVLSWQCVAVRGPDADKAVVVNAALDGLSSVLRLPVTWPGFSGFDLLGPISDDGTGADAWVAETVVRCGHDTWEAARIEAGLPLNGREITDATIAAEVGLVTRTVSFTKGCFTGQELVARIDSRGSKVARKLTGLVFGLATTDTTDTTSNSHDLPPLGATVWTSDGEHEVGQITSVAWSPHFASPVALATLHRRVTPPETVSVRWESGSGDRDVAAEARFLPLIK